MRAERSDGTAAKGADGGGVIFVGARARYYAIPRGALAEVLNEDDAARAREFRERRARVAAAARTAASDLFASIAQMDVSRSTGRLPRGGGGDFGSSSSSLAFVIFVFF